MRAFVLTAPYTAAVLDVEAPTAGPGHVVVDIARVGVCGTDQEFYTGEMAYLTDGFAHYPLRLGHEWCGTISAVGDGVDPGLLGRRTTGDTMLGCGTCYRCNSGRHHVCDSRSEIGVRHGWPGALAEQLLVPASALHLLPETVDDTAGALVEPGGNALRAVKAAGLAPGDRVLIAGPGTIGLLAALFARSAGAEVHLLGTTTASLAFAASFGFDGVWSATDLPELAWDAVIDATNATHLPAMALDHVEPGKRVVYIGVAGRPSSIDSRALVLKDVTAVGILGASAGLAETIAAYADGSVDPRPLVQATIGLDGLAKAFDGTPPAGAGPGPKLQVDPRWR
ncbi:alcohol dehydrogenase catalytic domain-containing protein [Ruania alkalisoli]|uniref:Alcohol dehydrogenase catalytic domain-containing protein n=1 Tax=Ruania alkalisoli TaxID=2779775 RepID=A0A7M1SXW0_9MICO|nr:alcohol dehydrogenase catalytic domain-containing protein [Ruania alkalisoli]QOR71814.1 alcohol dehydrogenase catalytic domain-containing protein [Ruania alkalisoli]